MSCRIAPIVAPYFTSATHDDVDSVLTAYGRAANASGMGMILYGLKTSGGMVGLITAIVGGLFVAALGLLIGVPGDLTLWVGVGGAVLVFVGLVVLTFGSVPREQAAMSALFPAPGSDRADR